MNERSRLIFGILAASVFAVDWVVLSVAPTTPPWLHAALGSTIGAAGVLIAFFLHQRFVAKPTQRLVQRMRLVRESQNPNLSFEPGKTGFLEPIAKEVSALSQTLSQTRQEVQHAGKVEAEEAGGQKAWLETILQNLSEGVFVCNLQHQIMLYNGAALALPDVPDRIGLGRFLGDVLDIGPVTHSLSRLEMRHKDDPDSLSAVSAPFFCNTLDGAKVFNGRLSLLLGSEGEVTGYLMTLVDGSQERALLAGGDALRHALISELSPMLSEIRRASARLVEVDNLRPGERETLAHVAAQASQEASDMALAVSAGIQDLMITHSTLVDVYGLDLIQLVQKNLPEDAARVTLIGTPNWVRADSLALVEALEALILEISQSRNVEEVFFETQDRENDVRVELSWKGRGADADDLETWLDLECQGPGEHEHLGSVLERHGTALVARESAEDGLAAVYVSLRRPTQSSKLTPARRKEARPEFYDASLMAAYQGNEDFAAKRLVDLRYVVFDCEMTGLNPTQGDEIVQIAAVPVVRKRILSGESVDWLVNPGRPIPPSSIKFHGVTDSAVADKPSLIEILPEFRSYVDGAVLVAHNAAFDLRFISMKETAAGVSFSNPVLDTMLLSQLLDGEEADHSLDALCERYCIENTERHTALGDTIATADLLVQMIGRLETQGLDIFGDVMRKSNMAAKLRQRSMIVAHGTGTGG
ncbi:MAG: exonuclease domain-containing protein [Pseudomonadota bacterium]